MTTLTYSSRTQGNGSALESLGKMIAAFYEGIRDGLDMAERYHALSRMSDEQLAKRGLARASVARAVVLGTARV